MTTIARAFIGTCNVCCGPYDNEEGHCLNERCESHEGCDPECIDPKQAELAEEYGLPHDDTTCACKCHTVAEEDLVWAPEPKGRKTNAEKTYNPKV